MAESCNDNRARTRAESREKLQSSRKNQCAEKGQELEGPNGPNLVTDGAADDGLKPCFPLDDLGVAYREALHHAGQEVCRVIHTNLDNDKLGV